MAALLERRDDLDALRAAFRGASSGRGSVALVVGEPGIGKTALVSAFAAEHGGVADVVWGLCDDLATPRPLGALRDLAAVLPAPVGAALRDGEPVETVVRALLEALSTAARPTILVLEDVHWADRATIDAIVMLGRRLAELPVLLVLTLRSGELDPGHPLPAAIDALQTNLSVHLEPAPLSPEAVASLAGEAAEEVHAATGGNPFFVTEVLAHGTTRPSMSLATVVLGRVARLDPASRALAELVAMVPARMPTAVLDLLEPDWPTIVEPAERRQLLTSDARHVRFRHELSRAATRASVPPGRRRELHHRVLEALLTLDADPAELVHHAEAAGQPGVVAAHAPTAARQAAAVGANHEALAHFRRALAATGRLDDAERARLWEETAHTAYLVGDLAAAIAAADEAIGLNARRGDAAGAGRCRSLRARLHMFRGDGAAARRDATAAVACLEREGRPTDLATAQLQVAELAMLASRLSEAVTASEAALATAGSDDATRIRALATIGGARLQRDPDDDAPLAAALRAAEASSAHYDAVLVHAARAYLQLHWVRPGAAREAVERGRAHARAHEVDAFAGYFDALLAWLDLREGETERARRRAAAQLERDGPQGTIAGLLARTVLTEHAVRDGDDDAEERLGALAVDAARTGELKRIVPVLELEVELALTTDQPLPVRRLGEVRDVVGPEALASGYAAARLAAWARVCGEPMPVAGLAPRPHAAMLAGDLVGAADAFGAVGWRHDRALVLSLLDEESALAEALGTARELGAAPLARRAARRLRALGASVPRGAHASTRANPLGLTDRQLEVLELVGKGLRNVEIAERLHISPRTVEHHVSGALARLGASSRAEAIARWVQLREAENTAPRS